MRVSRIQLDLLREDPRNARKHPAHNVAAIRRSLETFGQAEPLIVQEDGFKVIAGHGRLAAMRELGTTEADVVLLDIDDTKAKALALALNRTAETATWDEALLVELLHEVGEYALDLGWDEKALLALVGRVGGEPAEDEAPPLPKVPITKPGDEWILGRHRLICGDAAEVALPNGIDVVFADPPYGMNLDPNFDSMFSSDPSHRKTGARFSPVIGDDRPFDPSPMFAKLENVAEQFWFGADYYREHLPPGGSWVVWDKRSETLDAVQGGCFELCWSRAVHRRELARVLWSGHHGMQHEDARVRLHPTQKPLGLVAFFFERWIPVGSLVLDPYLGSGTTLIACEQLDRTCVGVELSPAYCDVVVARWEKVSGAKAGRRASR